jgi:hypothetical protein
VSHLLELVDEADRDKDGKIDFDEWQTIGSFELPYAERNVLADVVTPNSPPNQAAHTDGRTSASKSVLCFSPFFVFLLIVIKGSRVI